MTAQATATAAAAEEVAAATTTTAADPRLGQPYGFEDTLRLLVGPRDGSNATAPAADRSPHRDHPQRHPSRSTGYGLTARDVCEILAHTPSVALMRPYRASGEGGEGKDDSCDSGSASGGGKGEALEQTLDRASRLLADTLGLRRYDARKVLRSCPGLLTARGSRRAEQTVQMLTSALGVSARSIARDKPGLPALLTRAPSDWFRLAAFLASDAVRMPLAQVGPLLRQPKARELLDRVAPAAAARPLSSTSSRVDGGDGDNDEDPLLDGDEDCSADGEPTDTAGSLSNSPWCSDRRDRIGAAYRNMTRTAWALRTELGTADLGRVISSFPGVLLLDAEAQVLPAARFLMDELGVWRDDLPKVLQLYPALLGADLDGMRSVASYLTDELEVDPENLAVVFRSFPSLLSLSLEDDVRPAVRFLREEVGVANVGRFVGRIPPVLGYGVDGELRPKWEYFRQTLGEGHARLEVTRFPACLSYPLDRVARARFEYLAEVKRIPVPLVSLDQVLRGGDRDFSLRVARDDDGGAAFAAFVEQRSRTRRRVAGSGDKASSPRSRRDPSPAPASPGSPPPQAPGHRGL
jgi:hypothetical protein